MKQRRPGEKSETKIQWWVKTLLGTGGAGIIIVALIALFNRGPGNSATTRNVSGTVALGDNASVYVINQTSPTTTANESVSIYLNGFLINGQESTVGSVAYDRVMRRIEARIIGVAGTEDVKLQLTVAGLPAGEPFTIPKGSMKASVDLTSAPIPCSAGNDLGVKVVANGGALDAVVTVSSAGSPSK